MPARRRRILAAAATALLTAGLVSVGVGSAQAVPLAGGEVTWETMAGIDTVPSAGGRDVTIHPFLRLTDPAAPGTALFTFETLAACGQPNVTTTQSIAVDHDGIYDVTQTVPAGGYVRIYVQLSDGLGDSWDMPGNYASWNVPAAVAGLTATFTPDAAVVGTGSIHLTNGPEMNSHGYNVLVDGVGIGSHWVLWCDEDDFAYSGLSVGQLIEVRSQLDDSVVASFTVPNLPTQALDGGGDGDDPRPAADGDPQALAATGVNALPYLVIALPLLMAGTALQLMVRRRSAGN